MNRLLPTAARTMLMAAGSIALTGCDMSPEPSIRSERVTRDARAATPGPAAGQPKAVARPAAAQKAALPPVPQGSDPARDR